MRRHSGQKALYEAMSRSHSKPKRLGMLARLRPQLEKLRPHLEKLRKVGGARVERSGVGPEPAAGKPAPVVLKPPRPVDVSEANTQGPVQTWLRPKAVQFNDGRIEVSLPYQIGIIIGLGFVLLVMIGFWFGHRLGRIDERSRYAKASQSPRASVDDVPTPSGTSDAGAPAPEPSALAQRPAADAGSVARAPGDNVIVLGRHAVKTQLEPVRDYFRDHGTGPLSHRSYNGNAMGIYAPGMVSGVREPCPSVRLKAMRDGVEEFEYMRLLSKLDGNSDRVDKLVNGIVFNPYGEASIGNLEAWNHNPAQWDKVRIELGEMIEQAVNK